MRCLRRSTRCPDRTSELPGEGISTWAVSCRGGWRRQSVRKPQCRRLRRMRSESCPRQGIRLQRPRRPSTGLDLTGERSPHADPEARGCWFGLTTRHNRHHLARAVVEGVCFALRDLVEVALDLDVEVGEIRVAGGGARDVVWLQTLADVLGRPVRAALTPDASPYGAAALAMAAVTERNVAPLAAAWSRQGPEVEPNPQVVDAYSDQYEAFRALYPATRTLMHDLAALERRADDREAEVS